MPETRELELPILDGSRPFHASTHALRQVGRGQIDTDDRFLRAIYTTGQREQTLYERITAAEEELDNLAGFCGATVVKHTFGLYPYDDDKYDKFRSQKAPEGYFLAAEVETLEVKRFRPRPLRIYTGILKYRMQGGQLGDLSPRQFAYGKPKSNPDAQNEWILVDIEPRFKTPKS